MPHMAHLPADLSLAWCRLRGDVYELASASAVLTADERARAARFAFDRDRTRYILARAELRRRLGERLSVKPEAVELELTAYGKPVLAGRHAEAGLHFNLSHANDVAVFAFASHRAVGIDVEAIATRVNRDCIVRDVFSETEVASYFALSPADRPRAFMTCWTLKEAFVKAVGEGLSHPLRAFDVRFTPGHRPELVRIDPAHGDARDWQTASFEPFAGYVAAVAVRKNSANSVAHGYPGTLQTA